MVKCPKCDREDSNSILRCPKLSTESCPFKVEYLQDRDLQAQGAILLILGLCFLYVVFTYPFLWLDHSDSGFYGMTYRMLALSLAVIFGVLISLLGFFLMATRQHLLKSTSSVFLQHSWILYPYRIDYRTRILENGRAVVPKFDTDGFQLGNFDSLELPDSLAKLFSMVLTLQETGVCKLFLMDVYESSGKQLENLVAEQELIILPTKSSGELSPDKHQSWLADIITSWVTRSERSENPLGPSLSDLVNIAKHENVLDSLTLELIDRQRVYSFSKQYPELFILIKTGLIGSQHNSGYATRRSKLFKGVSFRQIRIFVVALTIILFTLGRFGVHVDRAAQVKDYLYDKYETEIESGQINSWFDDLVNWVKASWHSLTGSVSKSTAKAKLSALEFLFKMDSGNIKNQYDDYKQLLFDGLKDADTEVRSMALRLIAEFGSTASDSLDYVIDLLKTESSRTLRLEALKILPSLDSSSQTVSLLLGLIDKTDSGFSVAVFDALGQIGPGAAPAVPDLVEYLSDPILGPKAAEVLGEIGPQAVAAIPDLEIAVREGSSEISFYAEQALEMIRNGS